MSLVSVLSMVGGGSAFILRMIGNRFDEVDERFAKLEQLVGDVRERVARIEGRLSRR